jgi:hypothetical protein
VAKKSAAAHPSPLLRDRFFDRRGPCVMCRSADGRVVGALVPPSWHQANHISELMDKNQAFPEDDAQLLKPTPHRWGLTETDRTGKNDTLIMALVLGQRSAEAVMALPVLYYCTACLPATDRMPFDKRPRPPHTCDGSTAEAGGCTTAFGLFVAVTVETASIHRGEHLMVRGLPFDDAPEKLQQLVTSREDMEHRWIYCLDCLGNQCSLCGCYSTDDSSYDMSELVGTLAQLCNVCAAKLAARGRDIWK